MEYKVSQIVRSHDRQRSSTLQVHLKEFSKLSRDFERVKLSSKQAVQQVPSPNERTIRNMKSACGSVAKTKEPMADHTLEHIVEQTKNSRRMGERMYPNTNKGKFPSMNSKSLLNDSHMSLTEFYLSRTPGSISKFK